MSYVQEGDSIAYGFLLSSPATQCFGYLLSQSPWGLTQGTYYNFATTGAVYYSASEAPLPPGGISITDRYLTGAYLHRPTSHGGDGGATAVLFNEGGINDLAVNRTSAQLIADMLAYNTRAKADGFYVIGCTLLPAQFLYLEERRLAVNNAILAGATGADFVLDSAQALPDCYDTNLFADTTHPTAAGHAKLANYMATALQSGNPNIFNTVVFEAALASTATVGSQIGNYNVPRLNRGVSFDCVSGGFGCSKNGVMEFRFVGINNAGTGQAKVEFRKNGVLIGNNAFALNDYDPLVATATTDVEVGDTVFAYLVAGSLLPSPTQTIISGRML